MKAEFLNALTNLENLTNFSDLTDRDIVFLRDFKDYRGLILRFYTGDSDCWKIFSFDAATSLDPTEICDLSKHDLPDEPHFLARQEISGTTFSLIISPYLIGQSHLADIILILATDTDYQISEWHLFADHLAERLCSRFLYPLHLLRSYKEDPEKLLVFTHETQALLNASRRVDSLPPGFEKKQAELWFNDDSPVLTAFLHKLQREFNLYAAFLVQHAGPGFYNQISVVAIDENEDIDEDVSDMIEAALHHDPQQEQAIITRALLKTGKSEFKVGSLMPLVFSCQAGGVTYGHLGVAIPIRQMNRHISHRAKLMPMLANQLGLYFSHFYQLRKEALHGRMLQQINQTCNTINSSVDIGAILFKLVESLNYLFGQYSGAILTFSRETSEIEIVNYLGGKTPEGFDIALLMNPHGPVMEAINEGSAFDNRDSSFDLPIRYVLPLATTPQASAITSESLSIRALGGVVLFASDLNKPLSEEDLTKLMPILLNGISASLQVACMYAEKLDTIRALEGLVERLYDKDALLDEMILIIRRLLKVNRISFLELDESGQFLCVKNGFGLPDGIIGNTRIQIGEEISGYVAQQGKSYRIDNIESEGVFKKRSMEDYLNRSLLSVPLVNRRGTPERKVIGVINVNNKISGLTFTEQDQQLLEAIAHLVVTALENVRFLEEQHEKELLERQLKDARDIQVSLMPKSFADLPPNIEMFGKSIPARQIGGDFFDILTLDDGRLLMVLGDVSGKGMPAAILMAVTRMIIRSVVQDCSDPVQIIERVNDKLTHELDSYHFVTLQLVAINFHTGACEMSSAGHGPLMVRLNSSCQLIETRSGPPLGIAGMTGVYHQAPFSMIAGDTLIMFTDGLSEERMPTGEMFGTERITQFMEAYSDKSSQELTETLISAAETWRGNAEAHDDLTVFALKFKGITQ